MRPVFSKLLRIVFFSSSSMFLIFSRDSLYILSKYFIASGFSVVEGGVQNSSKCLRRRKTIMAFLERPLISEAIISFSYKLGGSLRENFWLSFIPTAYHFGVFLRLNKIKEKKNG